MVPVIVILFAVLAVAILLLLIVAIGMGGKSASKSESELAAKILAHLNGDAEPPKTLVELYGDIPSLTDRDGEGSLVDRIGLGSLALAREVAEEPEVADSVSAPELPLVSLGTRRSDNRALHHELRRRRILLSENPARGTVRQRRVFEVDRQQVLKHQIGRR